MNHNEPFDLRWSQTKGWLRFRDPLTGRWDEVWGQDVLAWKVVLVKRLRDEGWQPRDHDPVDDSDVRFSCRCIEEHESCRFGLGLDCLNGVTCTNPHHFGRTQA